jgi:antitoxin ParD1/3/4
VGHDDLVDIAALGRKERRVTTTLWVVMLARQSEPSFEGADGTNPMPTRNVSLTPDQDAFIDEVLKSGEYRDASEAVRDAIRALKQRRAEEALKLERLRLSIKQGVAALDRGDFTEAGDDNLDSVLDDLTPPPRR